MYIITWKWMIDGPPYVPSVFLILGDGIPLDFDTFCARLYAVQYISCLQCCQGVSEKNLGHQRWEFKKTNIGIFQQQKQGMIFLKPTTGIWVCLVWDRPPVFWPVWCDNEDEPWGGIWHLIFRQTHGSYKKGDFGNIDQVELVNCPSNRSSCWGDRGKLWGVDSTINGIYIGLLAEMREEPTLCDITGMQSTKHIVVPEGLQPFSRHYWQKQTNLLLAIHKINHPPFVVYEMCYIHTWDDLSRSHMFSGRDLDEHPSWEWVKNHKIPSLLGK